MKRQYIPCFLLVILLIPTIQGYSLMVPLAPPPELHRAASSGNIKVVRELLRRGADINATDSMLHTPLMLASAGGHAAVVKYLLRKNGDADRQNYMGETALMLAVQSEQPEVVRLLLRKGASPAVTDNKGWTALMLSRSPALSTLLIREGADVDYRVTGNGITALMVAAQEGNIDLVRILIQAGAEKGLADHNGLSALDYALQRGHKEIETILQ
jgi:ankyrin repeat protein